MSRGTFTAVKTEGGLLPRQVLEWVAAEDTDLPGMEQQAYHLPPNERLGEAINRSWNRLLGLWEAYSDALKGRGENDAATGLTRDRWLLPLFDELGYGRLQRSTAVEIERKSFAISHAWYRTPIHLVGAGVSIDKRSAGVAGAAAAAPHSLVQEFLNRSEEHLWAFVSNGKLLRILRDNHSLSRQAYVEFDLEAIMDGELFSDFRVLWLVCHQSRVEAEEPEDCLLEAWFQQSREEGVRALDALRDGVERAIEAFGSGFLRHPANGKLHEGLRSGKLDRQDYYRELLRLVYRLIFLFVAEDREALLDPAAPGDARQRYTKFYASNRLRELAGHRRGTAHDDLWRGLRLVLGKLHDGSPELGLPALGSFLWSPDAVDWIRDADLRNDDLLAALRALSYTTQDHQLLPVNWRTLGSEELGSVYESLLELHPKMNREAGTFELDTAAGHERKTTGSYYTPTSLVDRLLDSALEPVLEEAMRAGDPEAALLDLKVCDTAAGSGHFLVAAARRIALRLASVRTGDEEASPEAVTHALRDVVGRCIYGVDLNPLAVELCKVSLWMEALEPGKPLSFLDHHVQLGNSLLGTTPHLLRGGIPDDAFKEIEGDDKKVVRELRKQNRDERNSEQIGFHTQMVVEPGARYGAIETLLADLNRADDSTLQKVQQKEARYRRLLDDPVHRMERFAADAWCAAFVWRKTVGAPPAITEDVYRQIQRQPAEVPEPIAIEVRRLARHYRFFHFHLAFPDVFNAGDGRDEGEGVTGWPGGFDVVLGNPPWEHTELKEKEWFSERKPEIAEASGSRRKQLIQSLKADDPGLYGAFLADKRYTAAVSHFARDSGRYPLCGRGRINTYALFAEGNRQLVGRRGALGLIVPSGIATDSTTRFYFSDLIDSRSLASLYGFENEELVFPAIHHATKFCLLTVRGAGIDVPAVDLTFFARRDEDLRDERRRFTLAPAEIALLNPNSRTCPTFRSARDAEISLRIYHSAPVLIQQAAEEGNPWSVTMRKGLFNMTSASHLFATEADLRKDGCRLSGNVFRSDARRLLPLYEGKMIWQFDHRFGTYSGQTEAQANQGKLPELTDSQHEDADFLPLPRYWVAEDVVEQASEGLLERPYVVLFRDITSSVVYRTAIFALAPRVAISDTAPFVAFGPERTPREIACFVGGANSFAFDYCARQKVGGSHLNLFILEQLPMVPPARFQEPCPWDSQALLVDWVAERVLELSFTGSDLAPLGADAGCHAGPFRWDSHRRRLLRNELDAAFFHLFHLERADIEHVLDSFPLVAAEEAERFGEYRRKAQIVEIYEEMAQAVRTGGSYRTRLDPAPAHPSVAHEPSKVPRFAVPEKPAFVPQGDPALDPLHLVWALLRAARGGLSRMDVARALALRSNPALLVDYTPPELAQKAALWAQEIAERPFALGSLAQLFNEFADRQAIALKIDDSQEAMMTVTDHTPSDADMDAWYRFEARLILATMDALPDSQVAEVEEAVSEEDRRLLRA